MKSKVTYDPETGEPLIDGYPLYSGIPKREWVGLSYRDVMEIFEHWGLNSDSSLVEFNKLELCELFELVEAKLKEKNT